MISDYAVVLPEKTAKLIDLLLDNKPAFLDDFYLSGGTGLALHFGHRGSDDLDFFSKNNFNNVLLQSKLEELGKLDELELAEGTLNVYLNQVKLQFLEYPYKLIKETVMFENIKVSSVEDIACTKLQTIGMRGSKKDFIDLFYILEKYSLETLLIMLKEKYPKTDYSETHILKSLIYFDDAENQPMPRMQEKLKWEEIKREVSKAVLKIKM
jgi:nucleotidyltransferase AbiEii toxin of type IV toxin-antitoxin system